LYFWTSVIAVCAKVWTLSSVFNPKNAPRLLEPPIVTICLMHLLRYETEILDILNHRKRDLTYNRSCAIHCITSGSFQFCIVWLTAPVWLSTVANDQYTWVTKRVSASLRSYNIRLLIPRKEENLDKNFMTNSHTFVQLSCVSQYAAKIFSFVVNGTHWKQSLCSGS